MLTRLRNENKTGCLCYCTLAKEVIYLRLLDFAYRYIKGKINGLCLKILLTINVNTHTAFKSDS